MRPLLLFLVLAAGLVRSQAAIDESTIDIARFHKVNDHLYRGSAPSLQSIRALAGLGIATVLDLRPAGEKSSDEEKEVRQLGMRYVSVPLHGLAAPTRQQIERGLEVIEDSRNWPVFVHCRYGVDRTGTLIACYRIQVEAWPNRKAELEAEELGMHRFEHGMKRFILKFQPE